VAEDIVGLRFVTQGSKEAVAAIERYNSVMTGTSQALQQGERASASMQRQIKFLQQNFSGSARESGAYRDSIREVVRQFKELNNVTTQKATAEVHKFRRALDFKTAQQEFDRLRSGFESIVAALSPAMAAQQRYARDLEKVSAALKGGAISTTEYQRTVEALQARLNRPAAEKAARAEQQATQVREQAIQSYNRLRQSIDPVYAAQMRMKQAHDTVRQAMIHTNLTRQQAAATLRQYRASLTAANQATVLSTTVGGRLATQFLATANTIAILDGPLGGVASRFSAFGVLLGRTGLILAGVAVGFTALATATGLGVKNYALFEAQTARINAVLKATQNQVGLTSNEIERMGASIALTTLENETGVRNAIAQLLTFRKVSGEVFEDVIKTAANMAALGFGTVESETVKLAKALQDPRQSLASLSRSGITFTRQQRALIVSLVETGQQAEAMKRILENVNAQVGDAGQAAARGTMAGNFDTIGQAISTAARALGEFVSNEMKLRVVLDLVAAASDKFVKNRTDPNRELKRLRTLEAEAVRNLKTAQDIFDGSKTFVGEFRTIGTVNLRKNQLADIRSEVAAEKQRLAVLQQIAGVQRTMAQRTDIRASTDDLEAEIDLRRMMIGLTSEEAEARKILGGLNLLIFPADIPIRAREFWNELQAAGLSMTEIAQRTASFGQALREAVARGEELRTTLALTALVRQVAPMEEGLSRENAIIRTQLALISQGVGFAESRARAEADIGLAIGAQLLAAAGNNQEARDLALAYLDAARNNAQLTRNLSAAEMVSKSLAETAERVASAFSTAAGESQGLSSRLASGQARLGVLEAGGSEGDANSAAEIAQFERTIAVALNAANVFDRMRARFALFTFKGLLDSAKEVEAAVQAITDARKAAEKIVAPVAERLAQENLVIQTQLDLIAQGVGFAQSRARAESDIELAMIAQVSTSADVTQEQRDAALATLKAAQKADLLTARISAAEGAANRLAAAAQRIAGAFASAAAASSGLQGQLIQAQARLDTLRAGGSESAANTNAQVAALRENLREAANSSNSTIRNAAMQTMRDQEAAVRSLAAANDESTSILDARRAAERGANKKGGSEKEVATITSITLALEKELVKRRDLSNLIGQDRSIRESYYALVEELDKQAALYTEAELMRAAAVIEARNKQIDQIEEIEQMNKKIQQSAASAFTTFVMGSKSANAAAKDLLSTLAEMFLNKAFMQIAERFMPTVFSGFSSVGAGGAAAQGKVFGGGNVIPFARGGVVSGPTMFPMAGGRNGLMGEAGPEAIMPLKRTASGDLGVRVDGSRGGGTVVNVYNQAGGTQVEERRRTGSNGVDIVDVVIREVRRDFASGGFDQANGRYGTSPSRTKR